MAVTRTINRIRDGLEAVFETRSAPDDQIEFEASMGFMQVHADEDDEESTCQTHAVIYIWVSLSCPEMSKEAKSTCSVIVGLHNMEDADEVEAVGNDLWDALQAHRTIAALELSLNPEAEDADE